MLWFPSTLLEVVPGYLPAGKRKGAGQAIVVSLCTSCRVFCRVKEDLQGSFPELNSVSSVSIGFSLLSCPAFSSVKLLCAEL